MCKPLTEQQCEFDMELDQASPYTCDHNDVYDMQHEILSEGTCTSARKVLIGLEYMIMHYHIF